MSTGSSSALKFLIVEAATLPKCRVTIVNNFALLTEGKGTVIPSNGNRLHNCQIQELFARVICMRMVQYLHTLILPSDGVDRDTGGESGHLLKMSLLAFGAF